MVNTKGCGSCSADPKKCMASLKPVGDNKYQCFKGHVIALAPFMDTAAAKKLVSKMKCNLYKVEVFIENYSQQPVPTLGNGRLIKDLLLVNDEQEAKALIQKAKEIATALFKPKNGELEERFHQDKSHVVEAEYFVDNHEGMIGELFAIYSRL